MLLLRIFLYIVCSILLHEKEPLDIALLKNHKIALNLIQHLFPNSKSLDLHKREKTKAKQKQKYKQKKKKRQRETEMSQPDVEKERKPWRQL